MSHLNLHNSHRFVIDFYLKGSFFFLFNLFEKEKKPTFFALIQKLHKGAWFNAMKAFFSENESCFIYSFRFWLLRSRYLLSTLPTSSPVIQLIKIINFNSSKSPFSLLIVLKNCLIPSNRFFIIKSCFKHSPRHLHKSKQKSEKISQHIHCVFHGICFVFVCTYRHLSPLHIFFGHISYYSGIVEPFVPRFVRKQQQQHKIHTKICIYCMQMVRILKAIINLSCVLSFFLHSEWKTEKLLYWRISYFRQKGVSE